MRAGGEDYGYSGVIEDMWKQKKEKGWTVSFVCAAAGSVAEKNGTKPRRQETGTGRDRKFCAGSGDGKQALSNIGNFRFKNRAPAGDPVRRAGDGTALSDFFDVQEV